MFFSQISTSTGLPKHHFALIHCFLDLLHTETKESNVEGVGAETKKKKETKSLRGRERKGGEGRGSVLQTHVILSISGKSNSID